MQRVPLTPLTWSKVPRIRHPYLQIIRSGSDLRNNLVQLLVSVCRSQQTALEMLPHSYIVVELG